MRNVRPCLRSLSAILAGLGFAQSPCQGEEIAPFRMTAYDGYATLRYVRDDLTTKGTGAVGASSQVQSDMRSEIFLNGHGYIYHPNLLTLDIGGGPILQRQSFANENGETIYTGTQYNLSLRATVLKDKPYRGAVFFEHLNPIQSIAPGQVISQENTRYGGDFSLLAPVTPVPLNLSASHSESKGSGSGRIMNDITDMFSIRGSRAWGTLGSSQMQFQSVQQDSVSGSTDLPIQFSSSHSQGLNFDTRLQLGADRSVDLSNLFSFDSRTYRLDTGAVPPQSDLRFLLDLRQRATPQLQNFVYYDFSENRQGDLQSRRQAVSGGSTWHPRDNLELAFGAHGDKTDADAFSSHGEGLDGSVNVQRPLWNGVFQTGYGLRYERRAQQASAATTPVLGERDTLAGTTVVPLGHTHVVAGTVVVNNATRTQTFVENVDYLITLVGAETRIQRLVGGSILDGETVLVDYSYDVGGTYAYAQTDQTLNLGWSVGRYLNVYYRYLNSQPELTSGVSTFPLNPVRGNTLGLRSDLPFGWGIPMSVGGGVELENRAEILTPYRRSAADLYVQNDEPVPGFGSLRVGVRRTTVEYPEATQNVDLKGYDLRYWYRPWFGMDVSATANYERDDGGILPRRRVDGAINAQWRERKLSVTLSLVSTREVQGDLDRTRTLLQLLLRRDF